MFPEESQFGGLLEPPGGDSGAGGFGLPPDDEDVYAALFNDECGECGWDADQILAGTEKPADGFISIGLHFFEKIRGF